MFLNFYLLGLYCRDIFDCVPVTVAMPFGRSFMCGCDGLNGKDGAGAVSEVSGSMKEAGTP